MSNIKQKITNFLKECVDFPKSVYINFRCLPVRQAVQMPIRVRWNTKFRNIRKGSFVIASSAIKRGMIKIGFQGGAYIQAGKVYIDTWNGGQIVFNGSATIAEGANLYADGGLISFGNNFYANRNLQIQSEELVSLGDNVLIGWNVKLRDTDGHRVLEDGKEKILREEIRVASHVWIASDVVILKGTYLLSDSVVACGSIISGLKALETGCLIAGIPAKIKKKNISWIE